MKALIIDTSLEISYIILIKDYEIIFLKKIKNNLSKHFFLNLEDVFNKTNTSLKDLAYIAASTGPGCFTSLRIGANISKTFSYAKKIPLISYISMHGYTPNHAYLSNEEMNFLVAFEAKSEGLYLVEAKASKNFIKYLSKPQLFSFNTSKKLIEKNQLIISPHADILKEKFKTDKNKFKLQMLDPYRLVDITRQKYIKKNFETYKTFKLLYLRGPNYS